MKTFSDLIQTHRSCRQFSDKPLHSEHVELILQSALSSIPFKENRQCHFIVVDDKRILEKLADSIPQDVGYLTHNPLAIAIMADELENDRWREDAATAATTIIMQAEALNIGSSWIQISGQWLSDGVSSDNVVKGILDIPENFKVLCIVALGYKADKDGDAENNSLAWEYVHINSF